MGFWILANILVFLLLRYAAYMCVLTGLTMATAVIIKHYLRNANDLVIPFAVEHKLELHYDIMFWLCLGTGELIKMFTNDKVLQEHILFNIETLST